VNWQTQPEENLCSISQVRELTGLSARTIRYYEELGLLPGVRRRAGGRRVYGPDEIERLRFIQRLKAMGLSLAQVKELNAVYGIAGSTLDMLRRLDGLLGRRLGDLDLRIGELSSLRDEIQSYQSHVRQRIVGLAEGAPRAGRAGRAGGRKAGR
jgi:DNA-binding transcriptional MerR regulator